MFGKTIEEHEIGPLSYAIKKKDGKFRLWLGGCGIGRPQAGKPPDEIWEYSAKTLAEARKEMWIDASERLNEMIAAKERDMTHLKAEAERIQGLMTDWGMR